MRVMNDLSIGIIYTIKKYSTKEAIIDYLCHKTWSKREIYTDKVLIQCLRNTWCDLLDCVKYPSALMREYYHVLDYPWNMDEMHALMSVMAGVQVREKIGEKYEFVNGFLKLEGFDD